MFRLKSSLLVSAMALASVLTTACAYSHVKPTQGNEIDNMQAICLQKNTSRFGLAKMETFIDEAIKANGYQSIMVDSTGDAEAKDCTHYLKYSVRYKGVRSDWLHISFFKVIPNNYGAYDRIGEISHRKPILMDKDEPSQKTVNELIDRMLHK